MKFSEGLETLGTHQYAKNRKILPGVFESSAAERVVLPHTLKRIEYCAFLGCKNLKDITLPDRLEYIGDGCFEESALASLCCPPSLKVIDDQAFRQCGNLENV